jgi:hypothetical protein
VAQKHLLQQFLFAVQRMFLAKWRCLTDAEWASPADKGNQTIVW